MIIIFGPAEGYEKPLRDFLKSLQLNFTKVYPDKIYYLNIFNAVAMP